MEGLYIIYLFLCATIYVTLCWLEKEAEKEDEIQIEEPSEEFKETYYALFGERI